MTAMAGPRKSFSIHDYPEHLNPFHEEDNHNKIRFWTIGRKLNRSNSITFSGIKDIKNSWAFRSFMKKGKKGQQNEKTSQANGESSPIVYRRALQYSSAASPGARSTVASPERYVYGGSITPLPRSRFQERLRSSSQYEVNSLSATPRMARSEVTGSRLSVGSNNPFDEDEPVPPVRARRKKKRAPAPPAPASADVSASTLDVSKDSSELHISDVNDTKLTNADGELESEDLNFNVELKIVEDEDEKERRIKEDTAASKVEEIPDDKNKENDEDHVIHNADSEDDILAKTNFDKVDIVKYRRNSSVNDDDIRLRRGNLEDFHALSSKRSKSLTNALDSSYMTYDINLNEEKITTDANSNQEPQKVVCKLYDDLPRKQSIDTISSTEKEFIEIDKATRELEREISKLNSALNEDDDILQTGAKHSVSDIKRRFDKTDVSSPNPIPKPRRSHYGEPGSPLNGNIPS
ncbi:uncharacterized protein LOC114349750 isoform X1 [Ostrinia furnacalis]|uniref:uncharacterized protein LOC114349750 isoform X1 n=1 Tax=Ostrinia furnacalis TaxID=93504 RepID=UPI001040B291|nr:uncharacterized protein LOC114349750 isoform X1 [Ostrinia furnacalis]